MNSLELSDIIFLVIFVYFWVLLFAFYFMDFGNQIPLNETKLKVLSHNDLCIILSSRPHISLKDNNNKLFVIEETRSLYSISESIPIYRVSPVNESDDWYCFEAGRYLDYIIENYERLGTCNRYLFTHDHATSWHTDRDITSIVSILQKLTYNPNHAIEEGYCSINKHFFVNTPYYPYDYLNKIVFQGTYLENGARNVGDYCCACFLVSHKNILIHPKSFYIYLREKGFEFAKKRVNKYMQYEKVPQKINYFCGRVFEFTWSIIFMNRTENFRVPHCFSRRFR